MGGLHLLHLLVLPFLGLWLGGLCQEDAAVYIVTMKQAATVHYCDTLKRFGNIVVSNGASGTLNTINKLRCSFSLK